MSTLYNNKPKIIIIIIKFNITLEYTRIKIIPTQLLAIKHASISF